MRFTKRGGFTAALGLCVLAAPALANESGNEARMEQRIAELEAQLERVVTQVGASGASSELASRVADLERAVAAKDNGLTAYWKEGIRADADAGDFKFKIGGRTMVDFVNFIDPDADLETWTGDDMESGAEFRRVRFYMAGKIYDNVEFKTQLDFAGGDADFKDVYMRLLFPCWGAFTVGHFYAPFGLEEQTSSKYITFMERSLPASLAPSRKTGMMASGNFEKDNWKWGFGIFRESDGFGDDAGNMGQGEWNWAARIAGRPFIGEDGDTYLHTGVSLMGLNPADDMARVRSRGGQHIGPRWVDTDRSVPGTIAANSGTGLGVDAAFVTGPFRAQFEYAEREYDITGASDWNGDAWAIHGSVWLTGETPNYKGKDANFSRVKPKKNYGDGDGLGAFQVALRYDQMDLDDSGINGGEVDQITFGLNWHLNPNTRWMLNYVDADIDGIGDVEVLQMRFQIDF